MPLDILNIDYHVKWLCLKALNGSEKVTAAAKLLGISERSMYRYMQKYGIVYDKKKNEFKFKSEKAVVIPNR